MSKKDKILIIIFSNFAFNTLFISIILDPPKVIHWLTSQIDHICLELFFLIISILFYSITIHLILSNFTSETEKLSLLRLIISIFNSLVNLFIIIFLSGVILGAFPA